MHKVSVNEEIEKCICNVSPHHSISLSVSATTNTSVWTRRVDSSLCCSGQTWNKNSRNSSWEMFCITIMWLGSASRAGETMAKTQCTPCLYHLALTLCLVASCPRWGVLILVGIEGWGEVLGLRSHQSRGLLRFQTEWDENSLSFQCVIALFFITSTRSVHFITDFYICLCKHHQELFMMYERFQLLVTLVWGARADLKRDTGESRKWYWFYDLPIWIFSSIQFK